jgi:hypothetical protein
MQVDRHAWTPILALACGKNQAIIMGWGYTCQAVGVARTARRRIHGFYPDTKLEWTLKMTGEIKKNRNHGGKRAGAGRKPTQIEAAREKQRVQRPEQAEYYEGLEQPLEYMLAVMRDARADWKRRDDMARAAAPYCHLRLADRPVGKKEQAQADAQTAGEGSEWEDDLQFAPSKAN